MNENQSQAQAPNSRHFNKLLFVLILQFSVLPAHSSPICSEVFKVFPLVDHIRTFREQQIMETPEVFRFRSSANNRSRITVKVDTRLGKSASTVYLTSDGRHVVKQYEAKRRIFLYEILVTEFLIEQGLDVPAVVDYSSNAFEPNGEPVYVIKEYRPGLDWGEREQVGVPTDSEFQRKRKEFKEAMKGFVRWLAENEQGIYYLTKTAALHHLNESGDFHAGNWVYGPEGWILIDP